MSERKYGQPITDFAINRFENVRDKDIPEQFKAVAVDVDGVLTFFHNSWLNGTIRNALYDVAKNRATYLVTNSYGKRAAKLPEIFKDVPLKGIVTPELVALPDTNIKRYRKPHTEMLQYVMDIESLQDPSRILMFDDQLSTGIEAATRLGAGTVLLPRLGRPDHLGVRVFRRGPEALARAALGMPFRAGNFPDHLMSLEDWRTQEEAKKAQQKLERQQKRASKKKDEPEQLVQ